MSFCLCDTKPGSKSFTLNHKILQDHLAEFQENCRVIVKVKYAYPTFKLEIQFIITRVKGASGALLPRYKTHRDFDRICETNKGHKGMYSYCSASIFCYGRGLVSVGAVGAVASTAFENCKLKMQ